MCGYGEMPVGLAAAPRRGRGPGTGTGTARLPARRPERAKPQRPDQQHHPLGTKNTVEQLKKKQNKKNPTKKTRQKT